MYRIIKSLRNHKVGDKIEKKEFDEESLKFLLNEEIIEPIKKVKKQSIKEEKNGSNQITS